jgi:hypothetical protein
MILIFLSDRNFVLRNFYLQRKRPISSLCTLTGRQSGLEREKNFAKDKRAFYFIIQNAKQFLLR